MVPLRSSLRKLENGAVVWRKRGESLVPNARHAYTSSPRQIDTCEKRGKVIHLTLVLTRWAAGGISFFVGLLWPMESFILASEIGYWDGLFGSPLGPHVLAIVMMIHDGQRGLTSRLAAKQEASECPLTVVPAAAADAGWNSCCMHCT